MADIPATVNPMANTPDMAFTTIGNRPLSDEGTEISMVKIWNMATAIMTIRLTPDTPRAYINRRFSAGSEGIANKD